VAFFNQLAVTEGAKLLLIYRKPDSDAPVDRFDLSFCEESAEDSPESRETLEACVREFSPDCILMSGWAHPHFMRIARKMRRTGVYVVAAIDNQWRGTLKQYLGILTASWFLKPSIDTFLVAGERQANFARRLGYEQVLYGYGTPDVEKFITAIPVTSRPRGFLFVGRLIEVKNLPRLVQAYRVYRERVVDPWTLMIAGTGPVAPVFRGVPGVELLGFVQPESLPDVMKMARCLIMPSVFEPWGVAIHEGAAAGLPIIASYRCGATTALVRDGVNGFIVSPDAQSIAAAMVRIHSSYEESLLDMSRASVTLATLWTPRRLAGYFHAMVAESRATMAGYGHSVSIPTTR
jgi:glycosyltransferase involved in cell wall biosynthesis